MKIRDTSDPNLTRLAQIQLHAEGFYPAKIDGDWGPITEDAFQQWLDANTAVVEPDELPDPPSDTELLPDLNPLQIHDPVLSFGRLTPLDPARVQYVVIHHTANANPAWGVRACHDWHRRGNGWSGIGYHYFIEQSGMIYFGRANRHQVFMGAHVAGHNARSIGICLDGDYDKQTPANRNIEILAELTAHILDEYDLGLNAIRYHSDLSSKSCPGRLFPPLSEFRALVKSYGVLPA